MSNLPLVNKVLVQERAVRLTLMATRLPGISLRGRCLPTNFVYMHERKPRAKSCSVSLGMETSGQ
jgi:hypothetical protein